MNSSPSLDHRRPISSRETGWAKRTARWLKDRGIRPNTVSVWSAIFGLFAGIGFVYGALLAAALCMQLGAETVFVGSGIFKSDNPANFARAIVKATAHYDDPKMVLEASKGLGEAMRGTEISEIEDNMRMANRGW